MQSHVFTQILARPRHGSAQLARFNELPDEALTTSFVAETVLGNGRSSIDALRRAGVLETIKQGRTVRITVGSIRRAIKGQVIGHDIRPAPLADQAADVTDAALDGQRAAERILRQLDATTPPDRLFGKVFELLDRRDPADGPHPQLRAFLGAIQSELVRRGAA